MLYYVNYNLLIFQDSISKSSDTSGDTTDKPKSISKLSQRAKKKSWYSAIYPCYKSRSDDFKKLFKEVPGEERLVVGKLYYRAFPFKFKFRNPQTIPVQFNVISYCMVDCMQHKITFVFMRIFLDGKQIFRLNGVKFNQLQKKRRR